MALIKEYYKGTQEECDAYNAYVAECEGYHDTTTAWADTYCIEEVCYIIKHESYEADMEIVNEIPSLEK